MSRKLNTIQKRNNLNEIYALNQPGEGGACREYVIEHIEDGVRFTVSNINFPDGIKNGVTNEDLLEIVRDRLKGFQQGEFATKENACALTHIEEALMWLNKRSEDRAERGVLGKLEK